MGLRITDKDLQDLVDRINERTGSPMQPWSNGQSNIGNYHIDNAYGGVALARMVNTAGSTERISLGGFDTKRNLYTWMEAYLCGLPDAAPHYSVDDRVRILNNMQNNGDHFSSAIGKALQYADNGNVRRLEQAFPELMEKFK